MTIGSKVSQQFVMKEEKLGVVIRHTAVRAPFEVKCKVSCTLPTRFRN